LRCIKALRHRGMLQGNAGRRNDQGPSGRTKRHTVAGPLAASDDVELVPRLPSLLMLTCIRFDDHETPR
jgi:hypothetical protein